MTMGRPDGGMMRTFVPRWWQLQLWLWWWAAHRATWLWTRRGQRPPTCGVVDVNGERVRVVEETRVRLHNVLAPKPRHHKRR